MTSQKPNTISDLVEIMAALRHPETGCPWDQKQSFETIAPYTIEEAYEVADAIERQDLEGLRDELGDLLLQVVYHARMAEEAGAFSFEDVVQAICDKMIRRHPHVFGDDETKANVELDGLWERIKAEERRDRKTHSIAASLLDGVPVALPALTRSEKLQSRASRAGFDWENGSQVLSKVKEELGEFEAELGASEISSDRVAEEFGDLLFVLVNLARHSEVDPEQSLRKANAKFYRRFRQVEEFLRKENKSVDGCTLGELNTLWERVKAAEKKVE